MAFLGLFKRRIKLICFDLDNTLYDYGTAEAEAEAHLAELLEKELRHVRIKDKNAAAILGAFNDVKHSHMHHDSAPEKFSRQLWIRETIERLGVPLSPASLDSIAEKYEEEYWSYLVPRIRLFAGTLPTLGALSKRYILATITDSDGKRQIKLDRIKALGLDRYFKYIITTDDTKKNKPAIENWEYLSRQSGIDAKNMMMVGDHPDVDLVNAKKLGMVTVWSKEHIASDVHYSYVDHEILSIGQILDVLKKYG